jgi:hypothetical protein
VTERARWEYAEALWTRHHQAGKAGKGQMRDGYCRVTRAHRKAAIRAPRRAADRVLDTFRADGAGFGSREAVAQGQPSASALGTRPRRSLVGLMSTPLRPREDRGTPPVLRT